MSYFPKLALLVLAVLFSEQIQAQIDQLEPQARAIATDDPCAADLGVPSPSDNLSCDLVGTLICYTRNELCNDPGNPICSSGLDEGINFSSLDCKFCMAA
jgi:hypothetical protein